MGLDSIELILFVEKKFGLELADQEYESIGTIQEFADLVYSKIEVSVSEKCLTQILFYRIRRILVSLGNERGRILPSSKIVDLLMKKNFEVNWNVLKRELNLKFPELVKMDLDTKVDEYVRFWGMKIFKRTHPIIDGTLSQLIDWIISLNFENMVDINNLSNKYEVERIVVGIISDRMGVPISEIQLSYSMNSDLGID